VFRNHKKIGSRKQTEREKKPLLRNPEGFSQKGEETRSHWKEKMYKREAKGSRNKSKRWSGGRGECPAVETKEPVLQKLGYKR